jgi:acyl dehydratase
MAIDHEKIMGMTSGPWTVKYTDRETMLYALGVGMGLDPMNRDELPFVYENGLKVLPSQATVVAWDNTILANSGVNFIMVVHGEERLTVHNPLPSEGEIECASKVTGCYDKGAGKGAIILLETEIRDKATGTKLITIGMTIFARGDGGFGGPAGGGPETHKLPERAHETAVAYKTLPSQALIYRLSGDRNPLHADPGFAEMAGFPRPILHGLATYGNACRAVTETYCGWDPSRIVEFNARFSAPVFPGETLETQMWQDGNVISFRTRVVERDVIAINNGKAVIKD